MHTLSISCVYMIIRKYIPRSVFDALSLCAVMQMLYYAEADHYYYAAMPLHVLYYSALEKPQAVIVFK